MTNRSILLCYTLLAYFFFLLWVAPMNLLTFDTYYYWEWSRHLALSYYDGSPMIAYLIKCSTWLFGDTLFALSVVGITSQGLTCAILYKTARLFLTQEASLLAMSLWLFSPLVTIDVLKQTTYDTPLALFWALTLYFTARYITFKTPRNLYGIGLAIGLMMLSKYTGAVLILALLLFLLTPPYRFLLKTRPFYALFLISLVLFSPVIIWNYQHDWQSFLYQLTTHQLTKTSNPLWNMLTSFICILLPSLNFMLIPPLLCWLKKPRAGYFSLKITDSTEKKLVSLCRLIGTVFLCFYLISASQAAIKSCWLTPYLLTSALLAGYCADAFHRQRSLTLLLGFYILVSVCILINNTLRFHLTTPKKLIEYQLIQAFNVSHPTPPKMVIAPGWFEARMLFFLNDHPAVYTMACGSQENQYALWSAPIVKQIKAKLIKSVLYIDPYDRVSCIKPYFDKCTPLVTPTIFYKKTPYHLFVYTCTNGT